MGHDVEVFERNDAIGGLLRYGIPEFKMEKWVLDRRLTVMREAGIVFHPGVSVGDGGVALDELREQLRRDRPRPRLDAPAPARSTRGGSGGSHAGHDVPRSGQSRGERGARLDDRAPGDVTW